MAVLVYGPDTFTVGADANLESYDANWVKDTTPNSGAGGTLRVIASTDDVQQQNAGVSAVYGWNGQSLLEQKIMADIRIGPSADAPFPGLVARHSGSGEAYLAEWDVSLNDIVIYRVLSNWTSFTIIAQGGAVSQNTTYTGAYLKVTGTNPCAIEVGDDLNGAAIVTFNDSDAARLQSGNPGLSSFIATTPSGMGFDNVKIWDEAALTATLAWLRG